MLVIEKQKINNLIEELAQKTPVFVPVRREIQGAVESFFEEFQPDPPAGGPPVGGIDFNYLPTIRSIKEFFLPAKENVFVFKKSRRLRVGTPTETLGKSKFIIFGLNNCDMEALAQLDEIMAKPAEDYFYFSKRKAATIIGLINEHEKNSLAGPARIATHSVAGGDLVLVKINEDQYEAVSRTEKGRILVKNKIFQKEPAVIASAGVKSLEIMPQLKQLLLDPELLADSVHWSWKNDYSVWEELADLCLGCGICTYVCPLCYCFSIEDEVGLENKECRRCRQWDACTLPRFAQVSGGFNFHKTIKERYYNWYFHKFVRAYKEYGKSQCVACGRCQKYCPAKIDIEKYLLRIVENYKKTLPQ